MNLQILRAGAAEEGSSLACGENLAGRLRLVQLTKQN